MYVKNGLNKFLASLSGTEKFLGGSTRSLAYTDHVIRFGLNKFLAPLPGIEKFLGGNTRSLAYIDHIISLVFTSFWRRWPRNRIDEFKDQYSNQKGIY